MKKIIILILALLITGCSINSVNNKKIEEEPEQIKNENYYQEKYNSIINYLFTSYDFYTTDTIKIDNNNNDVKGYMYYVIASYYKSENKTSITLEELQSEIYKYFGIKNYEYINNDYNKNKKEYDISNIKIDKTKTIIKEVIEKENYIELNGKVIDNDNEYDFTISITKEDNFIKKIFTKL